MPKLYANGINIYYELHGPEDADVLVLSNGILMSTASWVYQTPMLSKHYRVLLYDCRGQWQSDHPQGPYCMEQHADDLAALLDELGIRQAHIGGISYGAELSLAFALKYPDRAKTLVLSSVVSQIDPVLRGIVESWLETARSADANLFFHATYPVNFGARWIAANKALLDGARARYAALDFDAVVNLCEAFLKFDLTKELHLIKTPTLLMVGEEDILKPRKYADIIAAEMPQAEYVIVPRAGHALSWEQPEVFNSLVLGFLRKHSG